MMKVMIVIEEAQNVERKRRQTTRKKMTEEASKRMQRAKSLIAEIRRGEIRNREIEWRTEAVFGKGSCKENKNASSKEKMIERIEEMAKREQQMEEWER